MRNHKENIIHDFCMKHANQANIDKYARYFKEGFDGYGIDQKVYEAQRDAWIREWKKEMTLEDYLDLGDRLVQVGKFEEISFAISFVQSERENYTVATFDRIGKWFDFGITNWATTDVLCMMVLSGFLSDRIIGFPEEDILLRLWLDRGEEFKSVFCIKLDKG